MRSSVLLEDDGVEAKIIIGADYIGALRRDIERMNPHFSAEMSHSRATEIAQAAERYRREATPHPRSRFYVRFGGTGMPILRLRPATRHA
jgi:hypothetical protein